MNEGNLRPFSALPPEELRELSRRGGLASGARRRELADLKAYIRLQAAAFDLAQETRREYRAAIRRYVAEEEKKLARRKRP